MADDALQTEALDPFRYIDVERTIAEFGYDPKSLGLKPKSNKKVIVRCSCCSKPRITLFHRAYSHIHCKDCAYKIRTEKYSGVNHPSLGKKHSEETRRKMSEARKGTVRSEETKQKMIIARNIFLQSRVKKEKNCLHCGSPFLHFEAQICSEECRRDRYKERRRISQSEYRKKFPEKIKEARKKYSEKNKEKISLAHKSWREKNQEWIKKYRIDNIDLYRELDRKRHRQDAANRARAKAMTIQIEEKL